MEQHKDIERYMDALDQVERTVPSEAFLQRMEGMAVEYVSRSTPSRIFVLGIAASLLLLVTLNIYVVSRINVNTDNSQSVQSYYDNIIPINSLYHE